MKRMSIYFFMLTLGCGPTPQPIHAPPLHAKGPESLGKMSGLHNVYRINDRLISGSSPEGDAGFQSLAKLGVKSIISVDGAKPEVERAAKFGMKYVHLPIGYDGISESRTKELAKAVRDLPGEIYIHCHHGMHRGPAAAMTAVRCLDDKCAVDDAVKAMEKIGTDSRYIGLFDAAKNVKRCTPADLDAMSLDFPHVSKTPPQVQLMVTIDEHFDHLKLIQKADWKVPKSLPDIIPAYEALMLKEQYRELARLPDTLAKPQQYRQFVTDAEKNAGELERLLRDKAEAKVLNAALTKVQANCSQCHTKYRDRK